jgi:basic membrane protein A and related proteins
VLKKVDAAVKTAIALTDRGEFKGGLYLGTLENGGVGITPFQGLPVWVQKLLPNIETEIHEITRAIIEGCLPTRTGDARNPGCRRND